MVRSKFMKKHAGLELLIFVLFAGVIGFTFSGLFRSFFQQDEWYSMGPTLVHGVFAGLSQSPLLLLLSGQGRLFGSIINNAAYYYFPFRIDILVWFALIIHTINTFLWYKVVHNFTGNRLIGIMSALFFCGCLRAESGGDVVCFNIYNASFCNVYLCQLTVVFRIP